MNLRFDFGELNRAAICDLRLKQRSAGFSLTELLIVITLIVIVLALALPAFNFITGSKSTDAAQNQISAMLGRARNEAVGVQEPRGVFFFLDPATDRYTVALIQQAKFADAASSSASGTVTYNAGDYVTSAGRYYVCTVDGTTGAPNAGSNWAETNQYAVDAIRDTDVLKLPKGVGLQVICDSKITTPPGSPAVRTQDAYLRCGAIMFDSGGRLVSQQFSVCCGGLLGQMMKLAPNSNYSITFNYPTQTVFPSVSGVSAISESAFGFVLFDREALKSQSYFTENDFNVKYPNMNPQVSAYGNATTGEGAEEGWLDQNAVPVIVNRYNGTLTRGE